jgi:hypothetical protein
MKQLKVLTCSVLVFCLAADFNSAAQNTVIKSGIYDFTGNTASEFYILAPVIAVDQHVWGSSLLDLRIIPAFAFNRTRYGEHYHNLFLVPLLTTLFYNFPNPESAIQPSVGMGLSLSWKADYNKYYEKTHYAFGYGFNLTGRLKIVLKNGRFFLLDMTYNLMAPSFNEEVNLSGVMLTAGIPICGKNHSK